MDTVDSTAAVFCNLIGNQRILTLVTWCHNSKHQIGQLGSQLFSEDTQNFLLKISIYLLWKWLSWGFMGIHLISFYWLLTKVAFKRWADEKIQHRTSHCFPPNIRIKLLNSYSLLYCLRVYVLHRLKFKNKMLKCTKIHHQSKITAVDQSRSMTFNLFLNWPNIKKSSATQKITFIQFGKCIFLLQ